MKDKPDPADKPRETKQELNRDALAKLEADYLALETGEHRYVFPEVRRA